FGIRRPGAAVLAGIVSAMSPEIIRAGIHIGHTGWDGTKIADIPLILFGLGAIQLSRNPDGILSITAAQNHARRLKRAARRAAAGDRRAVAPDVAATTAAAARLEAVEQAQQQAIEEATVRHEQELVAAGALLTHGSTEDDDDAEPILMLRSVRSGYGDVEVLRGIDLTVRAGRIT